MANRIKDKSGFVEAANLKYGSKFDYTHFIYKNAKHKSVIICPVHGELLMSSDTHMKIKYGCKECSLLLKHKPTTKKKESMCIEDIKERFKSKFGAGVVLDFSECKGLTLGNVTLICKKHGNEKIGTGHALLQTEYPCELCRLEKFKTLRTKDYEDFLEKARIKHGLKYRYPEENRDNYINRKSKITICCPSHGNFIKSAQKHLSGQGCFECRMLELVKQGKLLGGYSKIYFDNNPEQKDVIGFIYYLKVGDKYKIGITKNLKSRLASIRSASKCTVEVLDQLQLPLYACWKMEQQILKEFKRNRVYAQWSTELFDKDILKGRLCDIISNH